MKLFKANFGVLNSSLSMPFYFFPQDVRNKMEAYAALFCCNILAVCDRTVVLHTLFDFFS